MTPKEQLREKFAQIIACDFYPDMQPTPVCYDTADALLAAVEEVYNKDYVITVKLDDKQIEELAKEFQSAYYAAWAYGDPSAAIKQPQYDTQQY